MSTVIQAEAIAIVHKGLADVLEWLGEEPQTVPYMPKHAKGWVRIGYFVAPVGTPLPRLDAQLLRAGSITL